MSLPTKTDLLAMDFVFGCHPFVQVVSKSSVTLDGMDIAEDAHPMGWAALSPSTAVTRPQVFTTT